MTTKQFVIRFICGSLVVLSLIGLFNRIVDPFWYYREIEIKGFNAVKLEFRFVQKILLPQDKLIMETSRIFYGDDLSICNITRNSRPIYKNSSIYAQIQQVSAGAIRRCQFVQKISLLGN
jgi:hypothetical protein